MQTINQFRDKLGYIHLVQNPYLLFTEIATAAKRLKRLDKQKDGY